MGWTYKSPLTFPAAYLAAIRQCADNPNEPIMLGAFTQEHKANILAEKIRHLKWCVRQEPSVIKDLHSILLNYDLRTYKTKDDFGIILWLIARPTRISDFVENNHELAEEILPQID